jgi:hypothetical protein
LQQVFKFGEFCFRPIIFNGLGWVFVQASQLFDFLTNLVGIPASVMLRASFRRSRSSSSISSKFIRIG